MVILTQPARGAGPLGYFRELDRVIEEGRGFTEAIVVDAKAGRQTQRRAHDSCSTATVGRGRAGRPPLHLKDCRNGSFRPRDGPNRRFTAGSRILPHWPRIRLDRCRGRACGAGGRQPGRQADFDVWVVDDRHQYANRERFPTAQRAAGRSDRGRAAPRSRSLPRPMP